MEIADLLQKSKFKGDGLVMVAGHDEKKLILNYNSQNKVIPASITKLVTTAVVYDAFPPGTRFKTTLWSNAKIENGVLKGHLWLKGGGDPGFVSENLWYLVNIFKRTEIQKIEGKIIVDDSLFDQSRFDSSREDVRVDRPYDAPTGAMSFNWNSVNIFVRPGAKPGDAAKVFIDPENEYIKLINKAVTGSKGGAHSLIVDRVEDAKGPGDVIRISGKIPDDSKEVVIYKNVTKPDIWSGYNLKSFLSQRGIEVQGGIESGGTPKDATLLAEADGKEIQELISGMNKFSNNYVAEMLTKAVAAKSSSMSPGSGTIAGAMPLFQRYLKGLGVSEQSFHLINPSGLTRENKITGIAMLKLLIDMQNRFSSQPEFMSSLPIAGVDGTLKKRMKGTSAEGLVRGKTGSLNNVVSLAGYAGLKNGHVIPFAFIYNGNADESEVRSFFDRVATALVDASDNED